MPRSEGWRATGSCGRNMALTGGARCSIGSTAVISPMHSSPTWKTGWATLVPRKRPPGTRACRKARGTRSMAAQQQLNPSAGNITVETLYTRDLTAVTGVHLAAFPDSVLTTLGSGIVKRYYEWQMRGPHS